MQSDRPVYLNIINLAMALPLAGIVSFAHRITGIVLFFGIGFGLYALQMALSSPEGFAAATALLAEPLPKFIMLALVFVLTLHILAGIKHLLLDFHVGDSLTAARLGAQIVVVLTVIVTAVLGALLW